MRNDVLMRRETIPGQGFPLDEVFDRHLATREEAHLSFQLVCMFRVFGKQQKRAFTTGQQELGKFRGRQRATGTNQASPGRAVASTRDGWLGRYEYGIGQCVIQSDLIGGTRLYTDIKKARVVSDPSS